MPVLFVRVLLVDETKPIPLDELLLPVLFIRMLLFEVVDIRIP